MNNRTAKKTTLTFKIAKLWSQPEGSTEKHDIDVKVDFNPEDVNAKSNLKAELLLIKLKNEISAIFRDLELDVEQTCSKCAKKFNTTINIESAERQFVAVEPTRFDDPTDVYMIDIDDFTIDLSELVRQEIILHFAPFPVCSESCKGLCQHCGKDKNIGNCKCKDTDPTQHKPFANLKDLIK